MRPYFFILTLIIFFASCVWDSSNGRVKIKNNSNHDISVQILSDTTLHEILTHPAYYINNKIPHGEIRMQIMPGRGRSMPSFIESSINKKLNVFIFSTDTIEKHGGFEHIIKHKLYKRYEFTEKELDYMNWIIEYP